MTFTRFLIVLLAVGLALGGCARRKQITELQRKQAAQLASEADFAMTLRDWARAESVLAKAVDISPDAGAYWVTLGTTRIRLGKRDAARTAYKRALDAYEGDAAATKTDVDPWLQQVYVLALLGRVNDGRALLEKVAKKFPGNRDVRAFIERKQYDQMLADPGFKEMAL
jgi:tetratricopeptide (TPR) repeat protein